MIYFRFIHFLANDVRLSVSTLFAPSYVPTSAMASQLKRRDKNIFTENKLNEWNKSQYKQNSNAVVYYEWTRYQMINSHNGIIILSI